MTKPKDRVFNRKTLQTVSYFAWKLTQKIPNTIQEKEDFTQELLIAVWRSQTKFDSTKSSWDTFVQKVIVDTYKNILQKHFTKKAQNKEYVLPFLDESYIPKVVKEEKNPPQTKLEKLKKILSVKELTLLEDLKNMKITEIAKKNSEAINTLYKRIERIKKKIKQFF